MVNELSVFYYITFQGTEYTWKNCLHFFTSGGEVGVGWWYGHLL